MQDQPERPERPDTRPLAGPFPNLRTREIVRTLVSNIAETIQWQKWTAAEQYAFALGMVRSAREISEHYDDDVTAPFLADVLDRLVNGGVPALRELVGVVTGQQVRQEISSSDNFEGTRFGGLGNYDEAA